MRLVPAPEVSPAAVAEVRAALAAVLRLEQQRDPGWAWDDRVPLVDFVRAVGRHRVAAPLAAYADELALPDALRARVRRDRDRGVLAAMRLASALATLVGELDTVGVRALSVKGPALAWQTTGDPVSRGAGDLDLLVPDEDVQRALDHLRETGWSVPPGAEVPADPRSWAWRFWRATQSEVTLDREPLRLDLHWSLEPMRHALPGFEELWGRRVAVPLGRGTVWTLSPVDALVHSCGHAAKDGWASLRSLVDVHRLARHRDLPADWPARLRSVDRATTGIVALQLGTLTRVTWRPSSRDLAAATAAQDAPALHTREHVPGRDLGGYLRRFTRGGSRHPGDVVAAAAGLVVPPRVLVGIDDPHAVTAVPKVAARRARDLRTNLALRRSLLQAGEQATGDDLG